VIIASAANLLMIIGHFDLSVGSVLAICAILLNERILKSVKKPPVLQKA